MNEKEIKVLLIEDNPGDARLIREMLAEANGVTFDLECKDHLSTGLKRINTGGIDVVLLDLSLPDSQGLDTFIDLHAHTPELPIVVLSGLDDEEVAVKAVQEGAQDYLVKSRVDSDLLVRSIRYSLERKQAEEALVESEEKLRRILESSPDAITVTDLDGKIIECNQATLDMHGFSSKDEVIGANAFDYIAQKDQVRAMEVMMETLDQGHSKDVEYTMRTRDGREFPAELSASVIKDPSGTPTSFVAITKDITERKKMTEELLHSEKLASIGQLVAGMAHEVNNPLAGIMGYAEIIQDEENLDRIKEYSQKIIRNTKRASDIVQWLSRYSREAKDTNIKNVDLREVMDDAMEALTHTRRSSDVEVIKDFQRIPTIKGNRNELLQIFVNLMNNAVDAIPEGGRLNLSSAMDDGFVEIKVSDSGIGIPKDRMNKIFDPFFTTKEVGKGTGLGLYVISMLVKKHHGTIEVESELGKGTTFSMRFPISEMST